MSQRVELLKVADDDQNSGYFVDCTVPHNEPTTPVKDEESQKTNGQTLQCCPQFCYSKKVVISGMVLSVLATIVSLGVLIGFSVSIAHPYLHVSSFVQGTCTVESVNYTQELGKCGCSHGGRSCLHTYPCLEVIVYYYTQEEDHYHHSILYNTDEEYSYASHCSIKPHCVSGSNNKQEVEAFRGRYGTIGQHVPCFHHPTESGAVIKRIDRSVDVIHILIWPCVAAGLSLLASLFVFCHCMPKYCNKVQ